MSTHRNSRVSSELEEVLYHKGTKLEMQTLVPFGG